MGGPFDRRGVRRRLRALLEGFVVDEAARSRGIGAALLEAVESRARERGCAEIRVQSNVLRERAHSFYERNGYVKVKAQISAAQVACHNETLTTVRL